MLLIWGFKVRTKVLGAVMFFCPACGGDRVGQRLMARRWFTLFWIPIIPLKELGEVVRCDTCQGSFSPDVLTLPTTSAMHDALADAGYALTVMMVGLADDPAGSTLTATAVRDLQHHRGAYDADQLARDLRQVDPSTAERYAAPLADSLEVSGKERLVADLVRLGHAGGGLNPAQRDLVARVGRGLGLTPAHVAGIVATVTATSPSPEGP